jgi:hypothetical protein
MSGKVTSATVYPPGGEAVRYDAGLDGVSRIAPQSSGFGYQDGLRIAFADGSQRFYRNVPFHYDISRKGRPA